MMPHPQFREREFPWVKVSTIGCFVILLGLFLLFFLAGDCNYPAAYKQTLGNLKQVARSAALYTDDHDDRLPLDTSSVRACADDLRKYGVTAYNMVSQNPGSPEFLGNGSLSQAVATQIQNPNEVILFFDSAPWVDSKKRSISMVDTSVRRPTEDEFQKAVANNWRLVPTKP